MCAQAMWDTVAANIEGIILSDLLIPSINGVLQIADYKQDRFKVSDNSSALSAIITQREKYLVKLPCGCLVCPP